MGRRSWHTRRERKEIESRGGKWTKSYGVDGIIDGDPVEVRVAKKDDRFRIGRGVHNELVDDGGSYIFDKLGDGKPSKEVPASKVDTMISDGDWFTDRSYDHKFVDVDDIF